MHFYSGYCLRNESVFFDAWLKKTEYSVGGFSYGAIKALRHAFESRTRIDTLQLFSPAFFCNKSEGFKRLQLKGYRADNILYRSRFIENCFAPFPMHTVEVVDDGETALEELLTFEWPEQMLRALQDRGIRIEVYLGGRDAVIDADAALEYFRRYATVFYFKNANHFLQGELDESD